MPIIIYKNEINVKNKFAECGNLADALRILHGIKYWDGKDTPYYYVKDTKTNKKYIYNRSFSMFVNIKDEKDILSFTIEKGV